MKALEGGLERAGKLLARLALGLCPETVIAAHSRCEIIVAEKLSGGLRPLQMGSVCRRIAMSGICRFLRRDVQEAVGDDQVGVGASDGCAKVYHAALAKCRQNVQNGIMTRDVESAHQRLDRQYAAEQLRSKCPLLLQPFLTWYGRKTTHIWKTASNAMHPVSSERGVDQEDPLANPIFAVSVAAPGEALRQELSSVDPAASVFQVADDVQVVTKTNLFPFAPMP